VRIDLRFQEVNLSLLLFLDQFKPYPSFFVPFNGQVYDDGVKRVHDSPENRIKDLPEQAQLELLKSAENIFYERVDKNRIRLTIRINEILYQIICRIDFRCNTKGMSKKYAM
jgi:hypothetical protein